MRLAAEASEAGWVVLLGTPSEAQLEAALTAPGPVLVVLQSAEAEASLRDGWETSWPERLHCCQAPLAAEAGEICWYRYNDARLNGTVPPELLRGQRPNLQLESLELLPALTLGAVLESWRAACIDTWQLGFQGAGLLVILGNQDAAEALAGAGPWLEQLGAVLMLADGPAPEALEPLLAAACLTPELVEPGLLLWRRNTLLLLRRQLETSAAQCDQLAAEREDLARQNSALEERLAIVNRGVDEILALLDSGEAGHEPEHQLEVVCADHSAGSPSP